MISAPALTTFVIYFIILLAMGLYFYRRTANLEDYLLGGRSLGVWVTAISAQASDMSGWLLMGLPGAVYLNGAPALWIAFGLFAGTVVNWRFVARRLRVYTQLYGSLTIPSFFESRFGDPTGALRIISALITLFFFTIYTSSGLVASGKLFESMFSMDYRVAVITGGAVVIAYTFLGGFLAVSWTDLVQGALMVLAIVFVPLAAIGSVGGTDAIIAAMTAKNISRSLFGDGFSLFAVISTAAWGLGYFGQPHILARFMGIRSARDIPRSMGIAIAWVILSLAGAVAVGFIAIAMFSDLGGGREEKVFIYMVGTIFSPWIGGIMLAAILAAIMSTIDSQLLVSSSALTEDLYDKIFRRNASQQELVLMGRVCVIVISLIALFLAMDPDSTILSLVAYAWGGFGAAFGPLVLFALFTRRTSWQGALAGMITGTAVLVLWKNSGLGSIMYEIVPGFMANILVMTAVNLFVPQSDENILSNHDMVEAGEIN